MDDNGNAIVVWKQNHDTQYNIWARRYRPGPGWDGEAFQLNANDNVQIPFEPQIAMDAVGNAIAFWRQRYDIYTRRCRWLGLGSRGPGASRT